ncbi:MAG: chemotaxis protein CheW [Bacteroidales bacterium]
MKKENLTLLTFVIDDHTFALPLQQVHKVIRAVAVTDVPDSGDMLHGVFDFHGEIIPVVSLRKRFCLDPKSITPDDRFLIVNTPKRKLALVVDDVFDMKEVSENDLRETDVTAADSHQTKPAMAYFLRDDEQFFLICDMEALMNHEMELQLNHLERIQGKDKQP